LSCDDRGGNLGTTFYCYLQYGEGVLSQEGVKIVLVKAASLASLSTVDLLINQVQNVNRD